MRDCSHPGGLPQLSSRDAAKVRTGNRLFHVSYRVIELRIRLPAPVFLENPGASIVWLMPRLRRLASLCCSRVFVTDFCQHGARWRKRTRIQGWHCADHPALHVCCRGRSGLCSRTGLRHIVLSGTDPRSKRLWTSIAQPYPGPFCAQGALLLEQSAALNRVARLSEVLSSSN